MSNLNTKQSALGLKSSHRLLSFGLPLLLLLVFLVKQCFNFDVIGLTSGFNHPLTGWDHLLTMLAVGIWAAQLRGQAIWMLPLAFVSVMSLGGLAGASGLAIPSVDGIILLSCAVFSVLITRKIRFNSKINVLIVAFFAFFHGYAHGQEISTSASLISYTLGFMLATLLLHGAGILVAKLVVIAIGCLLTVLFSSSALAKTAESHFASNENSSAYSLKTETDKITYKFDSYRQQGFELNYHDFKLDAPPQDKAFRQSLGGDCLSAVASKLVSFPSKINNCALSHQTGKNTVNSNCHAVILLSSSLTTVTELPDKQFLMAKYHCDCSNLDFKQLFPDINHTPGKHLLSNGVGLTSPPQFFAVPVVSLLAHHLSNPSFSSIETLSVQLIFAEFSSSNPVSKTNFFFTSLFAFLLLTITNIASNCNDLVYLTTVHKAVFSTSLAEVVNSLGLSVRNVAVTWALT